jgi:hypothetical protein
METVSFEVRHCRRRRRRRRRFGVGGEGIVKLWRKQR